ncbi:MAG: NAD-dependent epimerase/dehydratase family protein, partial [Bacteroidetes bacterium]
MRIALTGATGFLGRHLLFEFAKQYFFQLDQLQILIFGRSHKNSSLADRIKEIFNTEFEDYLGISSAEIQEKINSFLEKNTQYVDIQLDSSFPISQNNFQKIKDLPIDHFFHLAAMPDLRNSPEADKETFQTNVVGTTNLLNLVNLLTVKEFDYVGTAYVCGKNKGLLAPDFMNLQGEFHNPYEKSKLQAEILVKEFAEKKGLTYKIFRPSVISGRLLEKELGKTNRFNVFYEIFAFLFSEKLLKTKSLSKALTEEFYLPLRAVFDSNSGINIVPVDYV